MFRLYQVEVSFSGQKVSEHTIEAPDALSAINLIETQYGEPPEVQYKTIHHENGVKEHVLVVLDWHGYCFLARNISRPAS
ncbi:MAG: hypothetical protein JW953_18470 [Anaerolineae bacterium]|nr:hypothetical protein [Anaerolineae bacterium]